MKIKKWVGLLCLLLLTACSPAKKDYKLIEKPDINRAPLQGRWVVTNIQYASPDSKNIQSIIGSDATFAPHAAVFDTQKIEDPRYVVRKGKTDYFLKVGYNKTKEDIGISNDNLFVINIYEKDRLLFTVYREKEDVAYIDVYGNLLQLVKTKQSLDDKQLQHILENKNSEPIYYSEVPGK
ncbi:MAG: hypothetical protein SPI65_01010 [Peptoniphilus sp.]|nr:hypothetical protein [Peptoniphilus sp.]MDD7363756.1 hypothetical protein [Bacillota bacterium]MDY6044141.1 hypothetical protein [Peptoniphilus sp.]